MAQSPAKEGSISFVNQTRIEAESRQQSVDFRWARGQRRVQLVTCAVQLNFRDHKAPRFEPRVTDLRCRITALAISQNGAGATWNLTVIGLKTRGVCGEPNIKALNVPLVVAGHNLR